MHTQATRKEQSHHEVLLVLHQYYLCTVNVQCDTIAHTCIGEVDILEHVQKFLPSSTFVL